jgi:parvulin-like peptidyl-prolyl isomerase
MRHVGMCVAIVALAGAAAAETADATRKGAAVMIDGVAAYVNSDMITVADVMTEVRRSPYAEDRSSLTSEKLYKLYTETLNALINRKLIIAAAKKGKLELQPWAVDNRIREIIEKNFGNDRTKLNQLLADKKISYEEWRNTIEEDLLVSAMRYQNVEKKIAPTPLEVRAEYDANRTRYQTETATAVSMIILDPPATNEDSVVVRAGKIKMALDAGESFASLAKKYSKDAKAEKGGSWGKVNPDDVFRPEIAEVVNKLTPGEVSEVIILDGYGYIVRKDEQQDARILTFEEAVPYVESRLKMKMAEKLYKEWVDRLRAEAYIKIFELPQAK